MVENKEIEEIVKKELQKEREIANAKLAEKDRIIQNLYHNLKNKLPKVYFSIENIIEDFEEEGKKVPETLRNSLIIAKDLEDTANVVLGAGKITEKHLIEAVKNKNNQITLKEIINESILNALNYIPLTQKNNNLVKRFNIKNMSEIIDFIKKNLFNINPDIDVLGNYYLSQNKIIDNRYSVTSVLSNFFDEIMINIFKYTVKNGIIDIKIVTDDEYLTFIFKNEGKTRNDDNSTGKGKYIIETTIESINGKYKNYWDNDIHITEVSFKNHWRNNG